ncbi:metabolite traffic protein EboE [Leptospira levettii]|uniref:Metabolite traffic protein EboE n=1 Tax=Leptospira levettii TaxID=2023178 RepID=A0AAW5V6G6_9LEPT|nr:metabolite traffic protein EboE [Leptospira levettii]MCW7467178.1 metabolite traffic protein EboE [Leptospira levettii]MCW7497705.1 metabolite traffic protein EboE [Leptospira levettii]MCW7512900.1 metabolite traffic protein EboE [Leptospira levettii]MCW7516622.1 metabolite traffic protein EboE [Leptospira levettii]TGM85780.1 xylose isomerase [Leptospira levettii]
MRTKFGHVTYCSNIHLGESWEDHFEELKTYLPKIKTQFSPNEPFGIGLRLSNEASVSLSQSDTLFEWKKWLKQESMYVISINGFPYGGFHSEVVKEGVYHPDWSTLERYEYTKRLFFLLNEMLPEGEEGGVSTPPLSYLYFDSNETDLVKRKKNCTHYIIQTLVDLIRIKKKESRILHLDIEPEPDGFLGTFVNLVHWYENELLPMAIPILNQEFGFDEGIAIQNTKEHIRFCFDVCHLAVTHEINDVLFSELKRTGIKVGRIQVSSALKVDFSESIEGKLKLLKPFDEKKYLHQVVAVKQNGTKLSFKDLGEAILNGAEMGEEWRIHFHVPIFLNSYGEFLSTQEELLTVLKMQKQFPFTNVLEIETYTWNVLPTPLQISLESSIIRELDWLKTNLSEKKD